MTALAEVKDAVPVTKLETGNNATLERPIQILYSWGVNKYDNDKWE